MALAVVEAVVDAQEETCVLRTIMFVDFVNFVLLFLPFCRICELCLIFCALTVFPRCDLFVKLRDERNASCYVWPKLFSFRFH